MSIPSLVEIIIGKPAEKIRVEVINTVQIIVFYVFKNSAFEQVASKFFFGILNVSGQ